MPHGEVFAERYKAERHVHAAAHTSTFNIPLIYVDSFDNGDRAYRADE